MKRVSSEVPLNESFQDASGSISRAWQVFLGLISDALFYLGSENSQTLLNNQITAKKFDDFSLDKKYVSAAHVDYLIQRYTTTDEKIEIGTFFLAYKPGANTWVLSSGPSTAGVTITTNADGDIFYTTTNQVGTLKLSRIVFRVRSIKAKSSLYSVVGNAGAR